MNSESGSSVAGDTFSLLCAASLNGLESMENADTTFQWLLSNNTSTYSYTNSSVSESQLVFDPLQYFHEGNVTCIATTVNNIVGTANYTVTIDGNNYYYVKSVVIIFLILTIAPTVLVNVSDSGSTADVGGDLSLSCRIFGHENLANLSVEYQWLKNGSTLYHNSSMLTFAPLKLSEAGLYTCIVTISSSYLLDKLYPMEVISWNYKVS